MQSLNVCAPYDVPFDDFEYCDWDFLCVSVKGSEWKEKAENLELELQQCYKAQSRLSEQLVVEVAESRVSKALAQEKEEAISNLQAELTQTRLSITHVLAN